jgi:DNA-binding response OmpR family regulator
MNPPALPANPVRIIVAEDDPSARAMLGAWLHTEGYTYELYADATTALAALAVREFDLLISDVHLPDRDGPELAAAIGAPNEALPVIFLTGDPSLDTAMRSVRVRAAAYLVKPPDLDELRVLVQREAKAQRFRRALSASRRHLAEWDGELERLEHGVMANDTRPAVDYLQVTVRHLGLLLGELDRSVSMLGADAAAREVLTQIDVLSSLRRTVAVLERTRESFKSKDLGELRKDLEGLLRRIDTAGRKST